MKLRVVTLFTLLLLISSSLVKAQVAYPRFQKHTVLEGETAKDVVEHFNVTLQDFCLLNDFPENVKLKEGQVVLIKLLADGEQEIVEEAPLKKVTPVKSAPVKTEAKEEEAKPVAEEKPKPAPVKAAPVVVEKTKPAPAKKEVAEEPFVVPPPSTKAVEIGPRGVVYNVSKGEYHTVAKGQTFFRVALIYGLSVDELKELNGLENTTIEIGQKLKVRK
jgi:LysM repeat protein